MVICPFRRAFGGSSTVSVLFLPIYRTLYALKIFYFLKAARKQSGAFFQINYLFYVFMIFFRHDTIMCYRFDVLEPQTFTDLGTALWWCLATFSTVGYGDMNVQTMGAKLISSLLMLLGLIMGLVSSTFPLCEPTLPLQHGR